MNRMFFWQKDFDLPRGMWWLTVVLLLLTLWIITRPNVGITGDAQFYAVQVLYAIDPSHYSQDLYFKFGSQDKFSIFSDIYKPFVLIFGLDRANEILAVISQVLWIGGVTHLARAIYRDRITVITAVAAAIVLPSVMDFFRVGEPYLTPRPFAEALTLFAIAELLVGKRLRSCVIIVVALAIHPLMALPGAALIGLNQVQRHRLWWLALPGVAVILLAVEGVAPFAELLQRLDQPWLSIVEARDSFCFVSQWTLGFWFPVFATYALAAIGLMIATEPSRRLLNLSLVISVGGFVVAWLGGDMLHNVLIVGLQTWRIQLDTYSYQPFGGGRSLGRKSAEGTVGHKRQNFVWSFAGFVGHVRIF